VRSVSCIPRDSSCHRGSSSRQSRRSRRTAQQNLTAQRGRSPFGHRCPAAPGASDSSSRKAMRGSAGRSRQGRTASHRAQLQHGPDLTCCHFSLLSTASKSSRSFRAGSEGLGSASATSATSSASAIRLIRLAGLAVNRGLNSGSIFIHSPQEMLGVDRENTRGNLQSRSAFQAPECAGFARAACSLRPSTRTHLPARGLCHLAFLRETASVRIRTRGASLQVGGQAEQAQ
jgi:hypothetical protein